MHSSRAVCLSVIALRGWLATGPLLFVLPLAPPQTSLPPPTQTLSLCSKPVGQMPPG